MILTILTKPLSLEFAKNVRVEYQMLISLGSHKREASYDESQDCKNGIIK